MKESTADALVTARVTLKVRQLAELAASERSVSLSRFAADAIKFAVVRELTAERNDDA